MLLFVSGLLAFAAFLLLLRYFTEQLQVSNLAKKAVFITGCDSGFGYHLALKCLSNGMPVFAACLSKEGVVELKKVSNGLPGRLHAFVMNVADDDSVKQARRTLEAECRQYGGLHGLVNNAGITGNTGHDDWLTLDDYRAVFEVNTMGVIRVTHETKHLLKQARGRIVTVASICARVALPGLGPYTLSKHAVSAYCDTLRQELRPFGVSVHILEPGFFKTPLINLEKVQSEQKRTWMAAPESVRNDYGEDFFLKTRQLTTEFLATVSSDRVDYVVDAYFHALTARFPRSRYQVGWDSILLFIPFSFLPTGVQDFVFMATSIFGPKPAACTQGKD